MFKLRTVFFGLSGVLWLMVTSCDSTSVTPSGISDQGKTAGFGNACPAGYGSPECMAKNGQAPQLPNAGAGNFYDTSLILDVDTSHLVYPFSQGTTDQHDHCYNCTFNTTVFDAFNTLDPKLDDISKSLPSSEVFNIIVGNASLSPGVEIDINGTFYFAIDYANMIANTLSNGAPLTKYTLGSATSGVQVLKEFRIGLPANATLMGALVETATPCVRANVEGPNGEYRDGALIVQAIPAGAAVDPTNGTAGLGTQPLYEVSEFNHVTPTCFGNVSAPGPGGGPGNPPPPPGH